MNSSSGARTLIAVSGLFGAALAATPWWLFPVCGASGLRLQTAAGGYVPMRCAYSANTLVALGLVAVLLAVAGAAVRSRDALQISSLALACVFAVALLVPVKIIGVCGTPTHPCRAGTLPAVLAEAGIGLLLVLVAGALSLRSTERDSCDSPDRP